MNDERKPLGLDAFEMPDTPSVNNEPVVDSVMPNINNDMPSAPVIDDVMPNMNQMGMPAVSEPSIPMIDDVTPVTNNYTETNTMDTISPVMPDVNMANTYESSIPVVDVPVTNNYNTNDNYAPIIDNDMPVIDSVMPNVNNEPVIDSAVPNFNNDMPSMPVIDDAMYNMNQMGMPTVNEPSIPVIDDVILPADNYNTSSYDNYTETNAMDTINSPVMPSVDAVNNDVGNVDSFDYNFDFESQVNSNVNYNNQSYVAPVEPEPTPAIPVTPVPIIMPEDTLDTNITSADSSSEGIISGPGNQISNTFNSYINDSDTTNNTLRTANIVKEKEGPKENKNGIIFLIIIFIIIGLFIILLPNLSK